MAHKEPTKQALMDFKSNILDNKEPESNIYA